MSWRVDVNTRTSQQEEVWCLFVVRMHIVPEVNETVGITELVVKDADSSKVLGTSLLLVENSHLMAGDFL